MNSTFISKSSNLRQKFETSVNPESPATAVETTGALALAAFGKTFADEVPKSADPTYVTSVYDGSFDAALRTTGHTTEVISRSRTSLSSSRDIGSMLAKQLIEGSNSRLTKSLLDANNSELRYLLQQLKEARSGNEQAVVVSAPEQRVMEAPAYDYQYDYQRPVAPYPYGEAAPRRSAAVEELTPEDEIIEVIDGPPVMAGSPVLIKERTYDDPRVNVSQRIILGDLPPPPQPHIEQSPPPPPPPMISSSPGYSHHHPHTTTVTTTIQGCGGHHHPPPLQRSIPPPSYAPPPMMTPPSLNCHGSTSWPNSGATSGSYYGVGAGAGYAGGAASAYPPFPPPPPPPAAQVSAYASAPLAAAAVATPPPMFPPPPPMPMASMMGTATGMPMPSQMPLMGSAATMAAAPIAFSPAMPLAVPTMAMTGYSPMVQVIPILSLGQQSAQAPSGVPARRASAPTRRKPAVASRPSGPATPPRYGGFVSDISTSGSDAWTDDTSTDYYSTESYSDYSTTGSSFGSSDMSTLSS